MLIFHIMAYKKTYSSLLTIFVSIFMLEACVETIDMSPAEEGIGVYCILEEGDKQTLKLSRIAGGLGVGDQPIENAKAWILRNRDTFRFVHVGSGVYKTTLSPQHGYLYRLEIEALGQKAWAETMFPENLEISKRCRTNNKAPWFMVTKHSLQPSDQSCSFILVSHFPDDGSSIWTSHPGADAITLSDHYFSLDDVYGGSSHSGDDSHDTHLIISTSPFEGKRVKEGRGYKQMVIIRHDRNYSCGIPQNELEDYGLNTDKAFIISRPDKDGGQWDAVFVSDSYADYLRYCKKREKNNGNLLSGIFDQESVNNINGGHGVFGAVYVQYSISVRHSSTILY